MKKVLSSTVALLAISGGAFAADLPQRVPTAASPATAAAPITWNGLYIGGNVGYGTNDVGTDTSAGSFGLSGSGITGGFQLGYNYQVGVLVLGLETDFNLNDFKGSNSWGDPNHFNVGVNTKMPWFGTTRLRTGIANGAWLFYGTGGVAYGENDLDGSYNCGSLSIVSGSTKMFSIGWTAGAGVEYKFAPNWSVGAEYLHLEMSGINGSISTTTMGGPGFSVDTHSNIDLGRLKVNYSF